MPTGSLSACAAVSASAHRGRGRKGPGNTLNRLQGREYAMNEEVPVRLSHQ